MPPNELQNDDDLIRAESELIYECVVKHRSLSKGACRHLREGFCRRLGMMQCSRLFLSKHMNRQAGDPPDPYLIEELNVHLNSYYINLRGCVDNLAWALNYQFSLVIANEEGRGRNDCNLFGKKFLKALEEQRPVLYVFLQSYEAWVAELKNLRDPVAHRVPLSLIAGFLEPNDLSQFDTLMSKAAAPDQERGGSRLQVVRQAYGLARFAPLFVISGTQGLQPREVSLQLATDHRQFLTLATRVVAEFSS